jgi:predicted dehydrogenase
MKILQVGLGGFGRNHIKAWTELGLTKDLFIAELNPTLLAECDKFGIPASQRTNDYRQFLQQADVVDIVTSTQSHHAIAKEALEAGKDVFIEKPMTATSEQAEELAALAKSKGRFIQVGYYYRFHPISLWARDLVATRKLGNLRYLSGKFMGFKRPRTDVGVTHTDAIHFIDLFNWILNAFPTDVYAVTRDHFGRGMEDLSIVLLTYPNGVIAKIESGYIQPARWKDKVVPNASTEKSIFVCGDQATVEADFEVETAVLHNVRHEKVDGLWRVQSDGSVAPSLPAAGPLEQIKAELTAFQKSFASRQTPSADASSAGIELAQIIEAIYESAKSGKSVSLGRAEVLR